MKFFDKIRKFFRGYIVKEPIAYLEVVYKPKKNTEVVYMLDLNVEDFYNVKPTEEIKMKSMELATVGNTRSLDYVLLQSLANINALKLIYLDMYNDIMKKLHCMYYELFEKGIGNYFDEVIKLKFGQSITKYKFGKYKSSHLDIPPEFCLDIGGNFGMNLYFKSYDNMEYFRNWQKQDWYKEIIL